MESLLKKLVKAAKKGDQHAFEGLVELYKDRIYRLAFRMIGDRHEAEDLAQEAFVKAYMNLDKYDDTYAFSTWLYRIATNLCIDRLRKKKPDYSMDAPLSTSDGGTLYQQIPHSEEALETVVEKREERATLQEEISKLPEKYRTAIILKYIEDLSLEEMSAIMELPVPTVKTRIHRGRELLKKVYKKVMKSR
ncbi:RNA polymerase sigma factor SigW [Fictibacillus macauensis ZFHKF-1]|uniref:RNA polymerase sigma factor n=1 Tax=Fictibacillus macauensis ZFHKF-1 TaxID=1196324 RepID=I8ANH0_9BACL|nr:RNA polymerase sigma factor SigW [Fictibacillus macauensis]EIT87359.1 RNA polymerase sigma factor SigW [Fictibacillus macauensis ZFHKF-1]